MTAAPVSGSFAAQSWAQRLWVDLQPAPGRLAAALRIVLATVIALLLMMVLQMPFASLGLYYIFLMARESPVVSFRSGAFAILTLAAAVIAEFAVVIATDNSPAARVLSVIVVSFISGVLMAASTMPALAAIFGFIYCTLIALWERPVPADALVKASLYLIGTVSLAFLCGLAVEYVFASRHPADLLAEQMRLRFRTIEGVFALFARNAPPAQLGEAIVRLNRLAATGQGPMQNLYNEVIGRDLPRGSLMPGSRARITMLAQLIDISAGFASQHPSGVDLELRARCAEIARYCREQAASVPAVHPDSASNPTLLDRVEIVLHLYSEIPVQAAPQDEGELAVKQSRTAVPFLIPGAVSNKDTITFALKLTICATICYIFYFAVDWPGISTSVTTVFLSALGHSGAIKQKLANRFVGSAIGGALAIGATAFLFPRMDSITSLVILIAAVAFAAAWWAGGRQFSYAGLQLAFAFYVIAFEGFSAPTELAPARDRLMGILVALVVIWLVFDTLWPVRTVTAMRRGLVSVLRGEVRLLRVFESTAPHRARQQEIEALRDQIGKTIAGLRTMNDTLVYEFGADREAQIRTGAAILRTALTAVPFFWNQLAVLQNEHDRDFLAEPGLIEMRRRVTQQIETMAEAVSKSSPLGTGSSNLVDPAVLESPRYGEYARNTIATHGELEASVSALES